MRRHRMRGRIRTPWWRPADSVGVMVGTVGFFLFCASLCVLAGEGNLIKNGDCDVGKDGVPEAWIPHARKGSPSLIWDREEFHSKGHSLKIVVAKSDEDGDWKQDFPVGEPRAEIYMLKAWIKADLHNTTADVGLVWLRKGGKWGGASYHAIHLKESCGWTQKCAFLRIPKEAAIFRIRLWLNFGYTGTGTVWFDDIQLYPRPDMKTMPLVRYNERKQMPALTNEMRRRGFVVFGRNTLRMIFPNMAPAAEEINPDLKLAAAPGEYEPITFAIRALRDLKAVVVTPSDLVAGDGTRIPGSQIEVRVVRNLIKKFHYAMQEAMWAPVFLEKQDAFDLMADVTRWVWLTVHVPDDVPSGTYSGSVSISTAEGGSAELPVKLEVYPFHLVSPEGYPLGYYDSLRYDPGDENFPEEKYGHMRKRGMTSVGFCGGLAIEFGEGRAIVKWDETNELYRAMKAYVAVGFPEPMLWLMSGQIATGCIKNGGPLKSPEFANLYRSIIAQVLAKAKEEQWPEIVFQPVDEPFHDPKKMARTLAGLKILKEFPGLRTEEDGNIRPGDPDLESIYPYTDVININFRRHVGLVQQGLWEGFKKRVREDGKTMWYYNVDVTQHHPESMRFGFGFGLIAAGASGTYAWAFQQVRDSGPTPYEGEHLINKAFHVSYFPPMGDETGGPSLGLEGAGEGVDDLRYLLTFRKAVAEAKARGGAAADLAKQAEKEVSEALNRIRFDQLRVMAAYQGEWSEPLEWHEDGFQRVGGEFKVPNGWEFEDYDRLRRSLARWIIELREE